MNRFIVIFQKDKEDFEKVDKKELMEVLFNVLEDELLFNDVIRVIKKDIKKGGNIFKNVVFLIPFTNKIVEEILKSNICKEDEFADILKEVFLVSTQIVNILEELKLKFRKEGKLILPKLEKKLEDVKKEINKHQDILQKQQELEKNLQKLSIIRNKTKYLDFDDIDFYSTKIEKFKEDIQLVDNALSKLKEVYKHLPKDMS